MILQLVKISLGIKDFAAMFVFSLITNKKPPFTNYVIQAPFIPNLEYWHYLDRPDFFIAYANFSLKKMVWFLFSISTNVLITC